MDVKVSSSNSSVQNSFSGELNIPSSAIDFKVLKVDPVRTRLFEEAVKKQSNCVYCFSPFSNLFYAAASMFVYLNKIPANQFGENCSGLYSELKFIREDCLERHQVGGPCFICNRRSLTTVCKHLKLYNGQDWRPPLRFATTFGYFITDLYIVWSKCPIRCVRRCPRTEQLCSGATNSA